MSGPAAADSENFRKLQRLGSAASTTPRAPPRYLAVAASAFGLLAARGGVAEWSAEARDCRTGTFNPRRFGLLWDFYEREAALPQAIRRAARQLRRASA